MATAYKETQIRHFSSAWGAVLLNKKELTYPVGKS
jgi:hypothetical protein